MRHVLLPAAWRTRALVITGVEHPEEWFSSAELATAETFSLQKRRTEWMLSRIAAKELARIRGASAGPRSIAVARSPLLSLSHSAQFGAAAMDVVPVGIDVEALRQVNERAVHLFLSEAETSAMERCTIAYRLLHFWCAKEAQWKRYGGEIPTLKKVPLTLIGQSDHGLRFEEVETYATEEVVVGLTV